MMPTHILVGWGITAILVILALALKDSSLAWYARAVALLSGIASAMATILWALERKTVKVKYWIGFAAAVWFGVGMQFLNARVDRLCSLVMSYQALGMR